MKPDDFFNAVRSVIDSKFYCVSGIGGKLTHRETHKHGVTSEFVVNASVKNVAFSLDKQGHNPFEILSAGYNTRNDLTICCLSAAGVPLVFVIECKNSTSSGNAQNQIECGIAFCEYLFRIVEIKHNLITSPKFFGVLAYKPKTPAKGFTKPQSPIFAKVGKLGVMRADWHIGAPLPLTALARATGVA
jgi:hypothetical protein